MGAGQHKGLPAGDHRLGHMVGIENGFARDVSVAEIFLDGQRKKVIHGIGADAGEIPRPRVSFHRR